MATYHHGDLRAAILRAAGRQLEKQGVGAVSLRAAARRAGVSHNAPYRHFPDREALLAALAAEGFRRLAETLAAGSARDTGEAYVRFALAHPNRFRLMFGGGLSLASHPGLRAGSQAAHEAFLSALVTLGIGDPARAAAAAWSLVHGLAQLLLEAHLRAEPRSEEFVKDVLGAVRFASRAQRAA